MKNLLASRDPVAAHSTNTNLNREHGGVRAASYLFGKKTSPG